MPAGVDRRELSVLAAKLKVADPAMRRKLPKRLRDAAAPVVAQAEATKPSPHFVVSPRTSLAARGAQVRVIVRDPARPVLPGLLEYGSAGSAGRYIRHPVYGRSDRLRTEWTWVNQPTKPFLRRALYDNRGRVLEAMQRVADDLREALS